MRWVYRLQQRIAITRGECNVILGLALLFCLGLTARYIQRQAQHAETSRRGRRRVPFSGRVFNREIYRVKCCVFGLGRRRYLRILPHLARDGQRA